MISMNAQGPWNYPDACAVMRDLRAIGVECGELPNGIWMTFDKEQHGDQVADIITAHGGGFCGRTEGMERSLRAARKIAAKRGRGRQ